MADPPPHDDGIAASVLPPRLLAWWRTAADSVLREALGAAVRARGLLLRSWGQEEDRGGRPARVASDEEREEKEAFLSSLAEDGEVEGGAYGYGGRIDGVRADEFRRLGEVTYLDHAGAALYSELQLKRCLSKLETSVLANPHSEGSGSGGESGETIGAARRQVLSVFNASPEEYYCVFTSGATEGLRIVGEAFPWSEDASFTYTVDNHNSVLGIRNYALDKGATARAATVSVDGDGRYDLRPLGIEDQRSGTAMASSTTSRRARHLFAFPAESNFSGVRYNLDMVNELQAKRCKVGGRESGEGEDWLVLLDAAKAAGTRPPDLSQFPADFVVISFYKIFGYPSGLGALLMRKKAASVLDKRYFGGGAVTVSVAEEAYFRRRRGEAGWEDGTLPFLAIQALSTGFRQISRFSFRAIDAHVCAITRYAAEKMGRMRHSNGGSVCEVYGRHSGGAGEGGGGAGFESGQGPVIAFNIKRADGSYVGYRSVEIMADAHRLVLRTGCHCNPGACARYLGLTPADIRANHASGKRCWDDMDLINGKPTGAVRVSFGYYSTFEDAHALVRMLEASFVERGERLGVPSGLETSAPAQAPAPSPVLESLSVRLCAIYVYPIKSCQGFRCARWRVSASGGLWLDRRWAVADASGALVTQKRNPRMAQVAVTFVSDDDGGGGGGDGGGVRLRLEAPGMPPLDAKVPTEREKASGWLSEHLAEPVSLVEAEAWAAMSNQGGCLLVSEASVRSLLDKASTGETLEEACLQFRPNFVVGGGEAFQEEEWGRVEVGGGVALRRQRSCVRCAMVSIDQRTGMRTHRSLLKGLSERSLTFGILVTAEPASDGVVEEGSPIKTV